MELCFVLVRPALPENIGAGARALKTMGFSQLRIAGSDAHRDKRAYILAHGAGDILDDAQTFPDLAAALADVDFSIATSAKGRHDRRYSVAPAELRENLAAKAGSVKRAAIVFGCEESGLSNAELALCDALSSIPIAAPYPSLNLGQAVMLYAYELAALRMAAPAAAEAAEWAALKQRLLALLPRLEVPADGVLEHWVAERSAWLGREDVRFMHMLCRHLEGRLGE
jgi:tRNA/rRNA methyltransferase